MGISIEQFRSRIRSHDNFVKAKDASSRLKEYNANGVLFKCTYLPTLKQVVKQYKMWNQVIFWFTQMMSYNVYILLLTWQTNDVEENSGHTILDIIDLIKLQPRK